MTNNDNDIQLEVSPRGDSEGALINLPHHVSKRHPQMSMYQRAAQFAPFAALTGHDKAIEETARKNAESYEVKIEEEDEYTNY